MDFDVYKDYEIATLNKDYSGTAFGVDFQRGYARVYGLPQDATEEDVFQRRRSLLEFEAAGEGVFSTEDADGRPQNIRGKVYTITEFNPRAKRSDLTCPDCHKEFDTQVALTGHSGVHARARSKELVG